MQRKRNTWISRRKKVQRAALFLTILFLGSVIKMKGNNGIINNEVLNYIKSFSDLKDNDLEKIKEECKNKRIPIIQPEVAQLLLFLVKVNKSKKILEIGAGGGYSSILLGKEILPYKGTVESIEKNPEIYNLAKENIKYMQMPNIKLICGDALQLLPNIKSSYDFIFMDAAKGQYLKLYPEVNRLLSPGGLLVADNVLYKGLIVPGSKFHRRKKTIITRLRTFLSKLHSNPFLFTTIIPLGDGVSVSFKEGEKIDDKT